MALQVHTTKQPQDNRSLCLPLFTMSYSNLQLTKQRSGNQVTGDLQSIILRKQSGNFGQLNPYKRLHVIFQTDISDSSKCCFCVYFVFNFTHFYNLHSFDFPGKNIMFIRHLFFLAVLIEFHFHLFQQILTDSLEMCCAHLA